MATTLYRLWIQPSGQVFHGFVTAVKATAVINVIVTRCAGAMMMTTTAVERSVLIAVKLFMTTTRRDVDCAGSTVLAVAEMTEGSESAASEMIEPGPEYLRPAVYVRAGTATVSHKR